MVHAATPSIPATALLDRARRVLDVTARDWQLSPRSAQALARRAPPGYVPRRARLRLRAATLAALHGPARLAHSW